MTPGAPQGKFCPQCGRPSPLEAPACQTCGHAFRQTFAQPPPPTPPPPGFRPGPDPTRAFYAQTPTQDLAELARRFNESRKLCVLTFWIGLFCLWPIWIVSYIEYTKMRNIKDQVALMGVDVAWWQFTYQAKNVL